MSNKKILLVDDEEDILDILSIHLESLGWEVDSLVSPSEVINTLQNGEYFLLITDIAMPQMSGDELIEKVAQEFPKLSMAIMTGFGYDPSHNILKLNKKYDCPIILKPFNFKDKIIENTIHSLWEKYHRSNL